MNVTNVLRATVRSAFAVLLLIAHCQTACCCDSTMLELLTGSSSQESFSAKLLVVSNKMQVTAAYAQAFNHAAAEKMHHEAMDSWLYVASQITSYPPGKASGDLDFQSVVVQISRELGSIRQQIMQRELDDVHDRLEICVTRMSLLAAIINGHRRMIDFLRFELVLLNLRPKPRSFATCRDAIIASDFLAVLAGLGLPESPQITSKISIMKALFVAMRDSATSDQQRFGTATLTGYLNLYNEFSEFKKILLAEKYFQP